MAVIEGMKMEGHRAQSFDVPVRHETLNAAATRDAAKRVKKNVALREFLICPVPNPVAEGPLPLIVATTLKSLLDAGPGVVAVEEGDLLKCLVQYGETLMNVRPMVVTHVPNATYTPAFDQLTWDFERVSYSDLAADLQAAQTTDALVAAQAGARQKPERKQQTIDKPRLKHVESYAMDDLRSGDVRARARSSEETGDELDHGA